MKLDAGRLVLSPSDLTAYLACPDLAALELALARGEVAKPAADNAQAELVRTQGSQPDWMHVVLGTGERQSFRPADFDAYYRRVRDRFARFVADPPATYPYPCAHCPICDFKERCEAQWERDDHLVRVANIRRDQVERLGAANVTTLTALGDAAPNTRVPRIAPSTFAKLRDQAWLQLQPQPTWHLLDPEPERDFGLLPEPSAGDLFF